MTVLPAAHVSMSAPYQLSLKATSIQSTQMSAQNAVPALPFVLPKLSAFHKEISI